MGIILRLTGKSAKMAKQLALTLDQDAELYYGISELAALDLGESTKPEMTKILVKSGVPKQIAVVAANDIYRYYWALVGDMDDAVDELGDYRGGPNDLANGLENLEGLTLSDYVLGALEEIYTSYAYDSRKWTWKTSYKFIETFYMNMWVDL